MRGDLRVYTRVCQCQRVGPQTWCTPTSISVLGETIGTLTPEAAEHLGLSPATIVAQGGIDAQIAMVGLGAVHAGDMALIMGSSHLHLAVAPNPR